ncbi:MAG: hypothetical protein WD492_12150 [Alkalispirochaeta sp.]
MNAHRIPQALLLLTLILTIAGAQAVERIDGSDEEFEPIFAVDDYDESWITGDTSTDGSVDYALKLDDGNEKRFEAMDYNRDGLMDDFYVYHNGVLRMELLDTNFDGEIDLWIHMYDGVRVRGYERDTNFDGNIDLVKEFGNE